MTILYNLSLIERTILKYAQTLYYENKELPSLGKVRADIYQLLKKRNLLQYLDISQENQDLKYMVAFKKLVSPNIHNCHLFTFQAQYMNINNIIIELTKKIKSMTPYDLKYIRAKNNHNLFNIAKAFYNVYKL